MNKASGEQSGGDLSTKDILKITGAVAAGVGAWVAYMTFEYDPHPARDGQGSHGTPTHLVPDKKARIISESVGSEDKDPSLLLRQTLPDGRTVTVRKPVFIGEVAIHEPGDKVIPSRLESPLP